nr:immunoglobulin light chain junction region [Macaca mulatta]
CQHYCSTPYSF